jgi:hypothetical protein
LNINDVRWNFEKFLVDQNGHPYMRFSPNTRPDELVQHIEELKTLKRSPLKAVSASPRTGRSALRGS